MLLCYCVFRPEEGTFAYVRSAVRLVHTLHPSELSPSKILIHELVLSFSLLPWLCLFDSDTNSAASLFPAPRNFFSSFSVHLWRSGGPPHPTSTLLHYILFCFLCRAVRWAVAACLEGWSIWRRKNSRRSSRWPSRWMRSAICGILTRPSRSRG